jgi:uncharacterized lipoprotein YmbA
MLAAALAAALAGCASAPSRFYTLESTARATNAETSQIAVMVGPVTVPEDVDRPEMVVQVSQNRVELLEFDRWAAPVGSGIARTVAGDLTTLLGTPRVASGPLGNFVPDYRVTIDVQSFDATPGDSVVVDSVWVVKQVASGKARSGRTVAREPVSGPGYDAVAAAYSRALGRLSDDVATAIRADVAATP